MPSTDLFHNVSTQRGLDTAAVSADSQGSTGDLDTSKFESFDLLVRFGSDAGATLDSNTNFISVNLFHASDSTGSPGNPNTYAAVSSSDLLGSTVDSNGELFRASGGADLPTIVRVGYHGSNRFIKASTSGSGSTAGTVNVSMDAVQSHYRDPVATSDFA